MSRQDLERLDDEGMAAWSNHDADAWVAIFADDFVYHDWTVPEPIFDWPTLIAAKDKELAKKGHTVCPTDHL